MYFYVSGWFTCDDEDIEEMRALIACANKDVESKDYYDRGWCFPPCDRQWINYVFFGSDIKSGRLEYIDNLLNIICDNIEDLDGYFHIEDEDDRDSRIIKIKNSNITSIKTTFFEDE